MPQLPSRAIRLALLAFFTSLCASLLTSTSLAEEDRAASAGGAIRPNVLFIAIDDLRGDLGPATNLEVRTPKLDAFARTARVFTNHYVQVPTCGASRCALLRGCYPTLPVHLSNSAITSTSEPWRNDSLPGCFHRAGYQTLALGKISHHPGGKTGKDWAIGKEELEGVWDRCWVPKSPWENPEAFMHGYANGEARRRGVSPPYQIVEGDDHTCTDAYIADEAITTLKQLQMSDEHQPFFFAVGFMKPHLPFVAPKSYVQLHPTASIAMLDEATRSKPMWLSTWHGSGELRGNYGNGGQSTDTTEYSQLLRQMYAAAVSYVDAQVGRVLAQLESSGLAQNTIVVVWGDHGFLLGEHAVWGKHCLYENALRAPLMIRTPELAEVGTTTKSIVETIDIFPTLVELCKLPKPAKLDGTSLVAELRDPHAMHQTTAVSYWTGATRTIRSGQYRFTTTSTDNEPVGNRDELFDYETDPHETRNHSQQQSTKVAELRQLLSKFPEVVAAAKQPKK
jgi:iduronate 2-sulfatase